jgi:hypothetical protein
MEDKLLEIIVGTLIIAKNEACQLNDSYEN